MLKLVIASIVFLTHAVSFSESVSSADDVHSAGNGSVASATAGEHRKSLVVSNAPELLKALRSATSGDTITLRPGRYRLSEPKISLSGAGTAAQPITVRAEHAGEVVLELDTTEGFLLSGPHWIFENLDIVGTCKPDTRCNHAFHIVDGADNTVIRNSRLREFNAMIKGSTLRDGARFLAANDVVIENNVLSNAAPRKTNAPVTFIDVVGGDNWVIRSNVILDFAKDGGNNTSYGAFLKGSSTNGLFDGNLVVCSLNHMGGVRIGLSFGGGGTGEKWLRDEFEHKGGIMRNNIVVNCSDVGIYLNKSADTQIYNNTLLRTNGIDVRFAETTAEIRDNVLTSFINERDGGNSVSENNLIILMASDIERLYDTKISTFPVRIQALEFAARPDTELVDSGTPKNRLTRDFCGNVRPDDFPDRGAVEYVANSEGCELRIPNVWARELKKELQSAPVPGAGIDGQTPQFLDNSIAISRGPLSLDTVRRIALWNDQVVELTRLEFELVRLMSSRPNEVISNPEIIQLIKKISPRYEQRDPVMAVILSLRRKFRDVDPRFSAIRFLPEQGVSWQL